MTLALIALCLAYNPSARSLDRAIASDALLSHFSYVRHNEGISSSVPFVPFRLARSAQVRNRINVRNVNKSTAIAAWTTSTNAPDACDARNSLVVACSRCHAARMSTVTAPTITTRSAAVNVDGKSGLQLFQVRAAGGRLGWCWCLGFASHRVLHTG